MMNRTEYLPKSVLWLMTMGAGLVVANNYYNQPLLGMIAKELGRSEAATSKIAMFTQMGYAVGLLLIIPLGDMFKRKRIILIDFFFIIASLLLFTFAKSLEVMIVASFLIGLTSVVPQIFIPIAAQLSHPEKKDKNVAMLMTGLLIGILASRVFSGLLGEYLGWREVFLVATGIMVVLAMFIAWLLPNVESTFRGTYIELMQSIWHYVKELPALRLAALRGGLAFGSFSVFWTVLAFRLEQAPYFAGSDVAGMLGVIGIVGAMGASLGGYLSDKMKRNTILVISSATIIVSWAVFGLFDYTYFGLIVGIILLDLGLACLNVTNQFIVYSTHPEAANRLNTVYMVSYFVGGSLGTFFAGMAWTYYQWNGVAFVGMLLAALCLICHLLFYKGPKLIKS